MSSLQEIVSAGPKYKTKLHRMLVLRGMSQQDLIRLIETQTGIKFGADRISKMVNGKMENVMLSTVRTIAKALKVEPGEIID